MVPVALLLLMVCMAALPSGVKAQIETFEPSSMEIRGSIVDNYANLTYKMYFDNTGSENSREVSWFFALQNGIRLSNVSVKMGETTFWGQVIPEQEAIETYEESVEMGITAALVRRGVGGYYLDLNIENNTAVILCVYVEGLLVRHLGLYTLDIPLGGDVTNGGKLDFDVSIISHYGPLSMYRVDGLASMTTTDLKDGIQLYTSLSSYLVPDIISLEYALDRQIGGSQLLTYNNGTQNFFAYLLAPSITSSDDQAPREYVFVLDRSGSMTGTKIQQAKSAFNSMIADMNTNDIFNVVSFSSDVDTLWNEPRIATSLNIQSAQNYVTDLDANGGTNFYGAGITGLKTFTDGEYAKVMLLLSDGLPTAGVTTNDDEILNAFQEENCQCVSISTVAFGYDADESLMANVALQNNGFFSLIESDEDASSNLLDFYKIWSAPVANSFSIESTGATEFFSMQPLGGAPFFNGSEVVISGRYASSISIETSVDYVSGTEIYLNSALQGGNEHKHVELIWAQYKLSWMLEMVRLESSPELWRGEITDLAMEYGLVVDGYTGMILVAQEDTDSAETSQTTTDYENLPYRDAPPPAATYPIGTGLPIADAAWQINPLAIGLLGGVGIGILALGTIAVVVLIRRARAS